jgi:hypothetical protein
MKTMKRHISKKTQAFPLNFILGNWVNNFQFEVFMIQKDDLFMEPKVFLPK